LYRPRKVATQNAFIDSFNGKFRDECLSEHWSHALSRAKVAVQQWRNNYNECHSPFHNGLQDTS